MRKLALQTALGVRGLGGSLGFQRVLRMLLHCRWCGTAPPKWGVLCSSAALALPAGPMGAPTWCAGGWSWLEEMVGMTGSSVRSYHPIDMQAVLLCVT